jgi:hypothetical protein
MAPIVEDRQPDMAGSRLRGPAFFLLALQVEARGPTAARWTGATVHLYKLTPHAPKTAITGPQ